MVDKSLQHFFDKNKIAVILVCLAVAYILYTILNQSHKPRFEMYDSNIPNKAYNNKPSPVIPSTDNILNSDNSSQAFSSVQGNDTIIKNPSSCNKGSYQENPNNLLPNDKNSSWSQIVPQNNIQNNMLDTTQLIGIDTIGTSFRNPNLQLRSEPPNPQKNVSPWMQTTIAPDTYRRSFELSKGEQ